MFKWQFILDSTAKAFVVFGFFLGYYICKYFFYLAFRFFPTYISLSVHTVVCIQLVLWLFSKEEKLG